MLAQQRWQIEVLFTKPRRESIRLNRFELFGTRTVSHKMAEFIKGLNIFSLCPLCSLWLKILCNYPTKITYD